MPWITGFLASVVLGHMLAGATPESTPARLHRRGMHCLEVLERVPCAIENFEALLDEREAPRALVGDAMIRLLAIYRKQSDEDAIRRLLRRYWDAGMQRRSLVHLPYSVRFFPADIDVLLNAQVGPLLKAPIWSSLAFDVREFAITCDAARREAIVEAHRHRVAEHRARREGRAVDEVLAEDRTRAESERAAYENRRPGPAPVDPIFAEGTCALARALGASDLRPFSRMSGGMAHADPRRSIAAFGVPGLESALTNARRSGRLRDVGPEHWRLPDSTYAGQPMDVLRLDLDELVLVPADMAQAVLLARRQQRSQLDRNLQRLAEGVPRDADAMVVLTSEAAVGLGMQGLKPSARNVLQALLPRPRGVQIALQIDDEVAIFSRVPIDRETQGRTLVTLVQAALEQRGRRDPKLEAWLRNLDLAQAKDRRALLASYIITGAQLRSVLGESTPVTVAAPSGTPPPPP